MKDVILNLIISVVGAALGWISAKLLTKREKKVKDLQIINDAISPLLISIKDLTAHNNKLVSELLEEQRKNLDIIENNKLLVAEKADLVSQIAKLNNKIDKLERMIKSLRDENNNTAIS